MPVPATLTSYLPVLLVEVTNHAIPDDTSFSTQPDGQVDYLSHEWREEDVWRSWRSMTRQKNAIANGMRLENASWRTWWKQRNKLKTISPDTLNWLKDSDVTWLYGPLHIGADWTHYTRSSQSRTTPHRKGSADSTMAVTPSGKKPILKRRSISQLLSLPISPFFGQNDSEEEDVIQQPLQHGTISPSRPPLLHTKSDTHLTWRSRPFRKDSPPRIIASDHPVVDYISTTTTTSSDGSNSTGSDQDLSAVSSTEPPCGKKKHISFNTFVEQCIAIEKPKTIRRGSMHGRSPFFARSEFEDGYDEDSEFGEDDGYDGPSSFYMNNTAGVDSDSEEDDEVLEIRSRRSRSSSSSRSQASKAAPSALSTRSRPPIVRQSSIDREHVTIAPIAPTMLKATGVGNQLIPIGEDDAAPAPKDVELVYVPPQHSIYSLPGTPSLMTEDVYHHRESYFSVGTSSPSVSHHRSLSADSGAIIPNFGSSAPASGAPIRSRSSSRTNDLNQFFAQQPVYHSPMQTDEVREDAYDYFGGPGPCEDLHDRPVNASRRHQLFPDVTDDHRSGGDVLRYGEGGASSVQTGRSSRNNSRSLPVSASPRIVVNEVAGAEEEREERSRESSPPSVKAHQVSIPRQADTRIDPDIPLAVSYVHGPPMPVPAPHTASPSSMTKEYPLNPALLSPREASRGRSPQNSPVSGSTTTGSYSHSSDSRSGSRGRSSTRNSSYSDRERSGSRSSRGTNSPMGSISPTGSAVGIGGLHVQTRGRDRDSNRPKMYQRGEERGRDRTGRKIGDSLSPPSVLGTSPSRSPSNDLPSYSPMFETKPTNVSPSASVCGSTVSGSSTASAVTVVPNGTHSDNDTLRAKFNIPIPSPIPEEEETRSRQPTPSNSPVRAFTSPPSPPAPSHSSPGSPLHVTPPIKSRPSEPVTSPSEAKATPPGSPTVAQTSFRNTRSPERYSRISSDFQDPTHHGTLVGRAAEIVQSARGFFNAMWNSNASNSS